MESLRLLNSLNTATFYARFGSCFLLLARFFVIFSVFLIFFIQICFPTDFMTFILKNPRNSMTKRSNVQTKQKKERMGRLSSDCYERYIKHLYLPYQEYQPCWPTHPNINTVSSKKKEKKSCLCLLLFLSRSKEQLFH